MSDALDAMNKNLAIARENLENLVIIAPIDGPAHVCSRRTSASRRRGASASARSTRSGRVQGHRVRRRVLSRRASRSASSPSRDRRQELRARGRQGLSGRDATGSSRSTCVHGRRCRRTIRRGQTVRMRLEIGQPADTLVLANGAFYDDTGGQWVFVVDASGDFAERRACASAAAIPKASRCSKACSDGERVITSSYESLMTFDRSVPRFLNGAALLSAGDNNDQAIAASARRTAPRSSKPRRSTASTSSSAAASSSPSWARRAAASRRC